MVLRGRWGTGCLPSACLPAPPVATTAAATVATTTLFSIPPPADARLPRLHDRCLCALLERILASLDERVDGVRRRRRLGTQAEEKFCLRERPLGIAFAIELQPRELEVRFGCPRREGDRPVERLLRRLVLPRPGKSLSVCESGGIRGGVEVRGVLERVQGGVLLTAFVERPAERDLSQRPGGIELHGGLERGQLGGGFASDARDFRADEERVGIGRIRQRRAGREQPRGARLPRS